MLPRSGRSGANSACRSRDDHREGDWTVGVDVAPGISDRRHSEWHLLQGIYKAGSSRSKIIDNGIATGGRRP